MTSFVLSALCAQIGAAAYDPVGVHVDAAGVLRSRTTTTDPRLAKLWAEAKKHQKDGQLLYVSLPRLFAEARKLVDAGKPLPDEIRYLGGMTRLRYVFVYPDSRDVVIAGPAEPFDASVRYRPLGRITGRPVLHIDDVVVAIRAFGSKNPDRIGCDIEITDEIRKRISDKITAIGPSAGVIGFKKACDEIAEAGGPQPVKFYGIDPETRFAFACVEADYRLKQLALGVLPSPVASVSSYKSMLLQPEAAHRFSLESDYEALLVSPDGKAYEIRGPSLKVNTGLLGKPESTDKDVSTAARRFKQLCNENFEALTKHLVEWADLANLGDLAILGAIVAQDKLAEKTGWDTSWVRDGFPVTKMTAPKSAMTVCSYKASGRAAVFISGGVWIRGDAARKADEGPAKEAARPEGEGWSVGKRK
ncbi:MAG: DUF1598 domain-containing protein [Planctomycetes bacterium]|nr:DUF1598 domain-containing protein [Planctomycetota bacterium]